MYFSPNGTFQVRIPPLLQPGAKIGDRRVSESVFLVEMTDDLCRVFGVNEMTVDPAKASLDTVVDRFYTFISEQEKATLIERKKIATAFGEGVYVRSSYPARAPCYVISFPDGKKIPPAEGAIIFVQTGQRVYSIEYILGGDEDWPFVKTKPVDTVLMNFFEGFKILK